MGVYDKTLSEASLRPLHSWCDHTVIQAKDRRNEDGCFPSHPIDGVLPFFSSSFPPRPLRIVSLQCKILHLKIPLFVSALFNRTLKVCCLSCTRLVFLNPFKSIMEVSKFFYNESSFSAMMPALTVSDSPSYFGRPFVKFINTPGVVYLQIDNSADAYIKKALSSITATWPLFAMMILLTVQGGVLIWLLVSSNYLHQFPSVIFSAPFCDSFIAQAWHIALKKAYLSKHGRLFTSTISRHQR